ncbi:hypothetical protein A6A40_17170 (plasmid) [Azospirillum humicireducens]|uniref:Uncharacterized protein n=1 Tax=Azospirillum humicireducens TaxID=1226968 RepID=A0A2R4VQT7_9PROT|nr:hypothetical protein [Azospirillum humicireducens]AWB06785.1 hypothetical protein A6A40_17170 [Azospirillum humicireducens]
MSYRPPPRADLLVEIDIPAGVAGAVRTISRRIVTTRDHGDGRWTCLLSDPDSGDLSTATIAPAENGQWVCVQPPVSVDGALHIARSVLAGVTLHRSVTEQMRVLSEAVLFLTGQSRASGPIAPARIERGR